MTSNSKCLIDRPFKELVDRLADLLAQKQRTLGNRSRMSDRDVHACFPALYQQVDPLVRGIDAWLAGHAGVGADLTCYKEYYQERLLSYLIQGALFRRAYTKPLGYPGDYEMMRMIHDDTLQGETPFAQLISRYGTTIPVSETIRKRTAFIQNRLTVLVRSRQEQPVSVLSIASGPALEIQGLIAQCGNGLRHPLTLSLLDQEPEALQYTIRQINGRALKKSIRVHYINQTLERYVMSVDRENSRNEHDLIYSSGLFDYFDARIARLMIRCLLPLVKRGGRLLIANVSLDGNEYRYLAELVMEWPLIYRSREELEGLISGVAGIEQYTIHEVGTGFVKFLEIRRG